MVFHGPAPRGATRRSQPDEPRDVAGVVFDPLAQDDAVADPRRRSAAQRGPGLVPAGDLAYRLGRARRRPTSAPGSSARMNRAHCASLQVGDHDLDPPQLELPGER